MSREDQFKEEKATWELVLSYSEAFDRPTANFKVSAVFFIASVVLAAIFAGEYFKVDDVKKINDLLLGFAYILAPASVGVLLAGFSIVATTLDARTFMILSEEPFPNENSKTSAAKILLSGFVVTVFVFVVLLSLTLFGALAVGEDGIFWKVFEEEIAVFCAWLFFSIHLSFVIYSILSLKSFTWNLYQSIIIIANVRAMVHEAEEVHKVQK